MLPAPSGHQFDISAGEHRATIVEVGAAIRSYDVDGLDVLDPFDENAMADGARGMPLLPWPNRLGDGRYSWDGISHQLPLTEPEQGNAIHGLLGWRSWTCVVHEPSWVVMRARLLPSPGYPFALLVDITYALAGTGLRVETSATNVGADPCPYGAGHHPYLSAGGSLDECRVTVQAATRIVTDERQLPTSTTPTDGTLFDLHGGPVFGDRQIDHAFTDLERDASGRSRVRLVRADGGATELWMDENYRYLQLYSGDTLAPDRRRLGLAVEPMTCPPDAFRTGEDVIRIDPGQTVTCAWGIGAADPGD